MKCDEARPQCGPCRIGQRPCAYGARNDGTTVDAHAARPQQNIAVENQNTNTQSADAVPSTAVVSDDIRTASGAEDPISGRANNITSIPPDTNHALGYSWFELLAADVAGADHTFTLSPPGHLTSDPGCSGPDNDRSPLNPLLIPRNPQERQSFEAAAFGDVPTGPSNSPTPDGDAATALRTNGDYRGVPGKTQLNAREKFLLSRFISDVSPWLDFFDPLRHFGNLVPHLALSNVALMNALLAVAGRYISLRADAIPAELVASPPDIAGEGGIEDKYRGIAVEYYYETLRYLHRVMPYEAYTGSQELVATALLISTYEMIDGSNKNWERHLKGVFWIQRSQGNSGESDGLRRAVWWAWLQQDVWVALLERRRVFSFWRPTQSVDILSPPELASRAIFLLAQCVNYASREELETCRIGRVDRGNELLRMLEDWKRHLPPEFSTLPTMEQQDSLFPPIWIHPPSYAAAIQMHHLSRILILTHRPLSGGFRDYSIVQRSIRNSVEVVCGIASTIEDRNIAASFVSVLCLFVAGTTVHAARDRAFILELIGSCERQIPWSRKSLRLELGSEWQKIDMGDASLDGWGI